MATTHVTVDVAAQNPLCAAISLKSDESAYLTAMCAAFVKRMAYARAVLKVDPEPALRSLAEKIAVRASADGIHLKVETAPRFSSQSVGVATPPVAKETERPSEDADERRSAKAQDLNPLTVPHVIRVPRAGDTKNEPRSSSSRQMETEDGGARDNTASDDCSQAPVPVPSNPIEQTDRTGGQPVSSGVKRDARTAELPDEDEQGGKFLTVEELTTVDAEEIPCEFSVEDDFVMDENTEERA